MAINKTIIKEKVRDRKFLKRLGIIIGSLLLLFLIANIGINLWLRYKLPGYIAKNSNYTVKYNKLDISMLTGNILATKISVGSKNPADDKVIRLDGTVDSIQVSRVGIWDALVNKTIHTDDILLANPNLKIVLAKPKDAKAGKEKNPVSVDNIRINNGNLVVEKYDHQRLFSINKLNLNVEELQLIEKDETHLLPFVFDAYSITGDNFYLQTDNVYRMTAQNINTKNGLMQVRDFKLLNLMSPQVFAQTFPKKKNLFHFTAGLMAFKDMELRKNRLTFSDITFKNPDLTIYTTNAPPQKKDKPFTYVVDLEDLNLENLKARIISQNGGNPVEAANLNLKVKKIHMDEETAKGNIPVEYESFALRGKNAVVAAKGTQYRFASLFMDKFNGDFQNVNANSGGNPGPQFQLGRLRYHINDWDYKDAKLKLDVENVIAENFNGKIVASNVEKPKKKADYSHIEFPLKIKNITVKNSNFGFEKNNNPVYANKLNAVFDNIEMNENTVKGSGLPFEIGKYTINGGLSYSSKFYSITAAQFAVDKQKIEATRFAVTPRVSRSQFIRMIPTERDLYDLQAQKISMRGNVDLLSSTQKIDASQLTIDNLKANIFRSKIPKDDPTIKPLYSELLRRIKFPMYIGTTAIRNGLLEYEEDTKASEGPGKLTFANFNLTAQHLNSGKMKGKPTQIPIKVSCAFFGSSPMNVNWTMNTASMDDRFTIAGTISSLPAPRINQFIKPYLKLKTTGEITQLKFDFNGNKSGLNGTFRLSHKDLKVSVLDEEGKKKDLMSAVANIFVKSDSKNYPEAVDVKDVKRDPTKSFFNMFWKGIEQGLVRTLVGNFAQGVKQNIQDSKGKKSK